MSGRPEELFGLFAGLETLHGVGPKTARSLAGLEVTAPRDLLYTLPHAVIDRQPRDTIEGLSLPAVVTVAVTIGAHRKPRNKGAAYRVTVQDAGAAFQLVFFHARGDYWSKALPEGARRIVSGKMELFDGMPQMVHPDYIVSPGEAETIPRFEPVYPLTAGVTQKQMFNATRGALSLIPELPEWIDPAQLTKARWPDLRQALEAAHAPRNAADVAPVAPARERLAYDELFAHQLTLALARARHRRMAGRVSRGDGHLQARVLQSLPYKATGAQQRAIAEINEDLGSRYRMNRLLQGDVGAGKTLVAFMALLRAVEAGGQGVMMAPTEILARQHAEGLGPLAEKAGVVLGILTGRDKGKERKAKLAALARGDIHVLLGTHAVFQKD
ncbi:MAG: DEAD/DEAH box helicase, partial [Roseobacter sp.]